MSFLRTLMNYTKVIKEKKGEKTNWYESLKSNILSLHAFIAKKKELGSKHHCGVPTREKSFC